MTKKFCDQCGKEITEKPGSIAFNVRGAITPTSGTAKELRADFEVCSKDCAGTAFAKLMEES